MKKQEQQFADLRALWRGDPCQFVIDVFPKARKYEHQFEIMRAVKEHKKVAVRSGHGIGKDATAAMLVWWFLISFDFPKIPCTASTSNQLDAVLWGELRKFHSRMGMPAWIANQYEVIDGEARNKEYPKEWWSHCITARKGEEQSAAGIHEDNILIIIDEASEVSDKFVETLFGSLSGTNVHVLAIGNPIKFSGFFFKCFHALSNLFYPMHFDGEEISTKYPELVSPELIEYYATYGKDSDTYRYRVKGEFPTQGSRQLIAVDKLKESYERVVAKTGECVIVVDVARFGGDKSVIGVVDGRDISIWNKFDKLDTIELVGKILECIDDITESGRIVSRVLIDDGGGYGGGPIDVLSRRVPAHIEVVGFLGQSTSLLVGTKRYPILLSDGTPLSHKFANLRSCAYWHLAKAIDKGQVRLPYDRDLENQLLNIPYRYGNGDKVEIPSKSDLRKGITIEDRHYKLPRSPDEADVCAMALSPLATIAGYNEEAFEGSYDDKDDPDYGLDVNGQRAKTNSYVGILGW